jgi:hypothetical protein
MINSIKKWVVYTLISAILGLLLGFVLIWLWSLSRMFWGGYGDSGPGWIITVNKVVFYGGFIIGIISGQLLFFFNKRITSLLEKRTQRSI